jgi:thioredoxin 1
VTGEFDVFEMTTEYFNPGPTREDVDSSRGSLVLEFGTDWCGFCRAAAASIEEALSEFPFLRHVKVEDGPGRRLGRSFQVKLWPTLIFLKDGSEVARVVRPRNAEEIRAALTKMPGDKAGQLT